MFTCSTPSCWKIGLDPILVKAGPFNLGWYGVMIAIGFILAIWIATREAERRGIDPDQLLSAILVAALVGLIGSRLYYVLESDPGMLVSHPGDALALWNGGLSFFGGIFGAVLGGWLYCVRYGLPTLRVLDIGALAAPLGQAVGRIGSIVNGDVPGYFTHNYGVAYTSLHNGVVAGFLGRPMHPVAVYEAVFDLALFAFLYFVMRNRNLGPGRLTGLYLALFAIGELAIFAFRANPTVLWGLKQGQLTALPVVAAGLWLYLSAPAGLLAPAPAAGGGGTPGAEPMPTAAPTPVAAPSSAADHATAAESATAVEPSTAMEPSTAAEPTAPESTTAHSPATTADQADASVSATESNPGGEPPAAESA